MSSVSVPPIVVELHRGEVIESVHRAYVCLVDTSGKVHYELGDPNYVTYLRSSAKPLQALSLFQSGAMKKYGLKGQHLAIATGSHNGEPLHQQTVKEMIDAAGLSLICLKCGTHMPFDEVTRKKLYETGEDSQPIHHNCSGKHAGMLLTASVLGESVDDYLEFDHPVQTKIIQNIARFADISETDIKLGRDGCSAPAHAMSMKSAAKAFARLVEPAGMSEEDVSTARVITSSMREHPLMVAGSSGRICTPLIQFGKYDLIAKAGAEGYYAAGWIDPEDGRGRGLTVKIEDGNQRGRDPLVIALLQNFGVLDTDLPDELQIFVSERLTNHANMEVGSVKVLL